MRDIVLSDNWNYSSLISFRGTVGTCEIAIDKVLVSRETCVALDPLLVHSYTDSSKERGTPVHVPGVSVVY